MSAYVIAEIEVTNAEKYKEYMKEVPAVVEKFGGKYIVRSDRAELLAGEQGPRRMVILEFESGQQVRDWWNSAEYAPLRKIREASATSRVILIPEA